MSHPTPAELPDPEWPNDPLGAEEFGNPFARIGNLLGILAILGYGLFTVLPNSSTLMWFWPLPLVWLLVLVSGSLWSVIQGMRPLGSGWDALMALTLVGMGVSTLTSRWPELGLNATLLAALHVVILYGLRQWLRTPQHRIWLLQGIGLLGIGFAAWSLGLWGKEIFLPAVQERIDVGTPIVFASNRFQNLYPLGHQNYVAGFGILLLPCLVGLVWLQRFSAWRWLWGLGVGLVLVDIWSTQSRGSWLGLGFLGVVAAIWVLQRRLANRGLTLVAVGGILAVLGLGIALNPRLQATVMTVGLGRWDGFQYRAVGWSAALGMIRDHPWFGVGPGTSAWWFPHYRPDWAGSQAEAMWQLHNTPLQLVAELGIPGGLVIGGVVVLWIRLLGRLVQQSQRVDPESWGFGVSLGLSGLGYAVLSLTDFQLDIPAISGMLLVVLAGLSAVAQEIESSPSGASPPFLAPELKAARPFPSKIPLALLQKRVLTVGIPLLLLLGGVGLIPRYRAMAASNRGFQSWFESQIVARSGQVEQQPQLQAAARQDLQQAHEIAPFEPFYPLELAWMTGIPLDLQVGEPLASPLSSDYTAVLDWLKTGQDLLPYDEYFSTNLGWLLLPVDPGQAEQAFLTSGDLLPSRRWVASGLGLSRLAQGKAGLMPLVVEVIRQPMLIGSPLWAELMDPATRQTWQETLERTYQQLSDQFPQVTWLRLNWAALRWWWGDHLGSATLLKDLDSPLLSALLAASQDQPSAALQYLSTSPPSEGNALLRAWLQPEQRLQWLQGVNLSLLPAQYRPELVNSLDTAATLREWIQLPLWTAVVRPARGYTVLGTYRRSDAPLLTDIVGFPVNRLLSSYWSDPFTAGGISPELDAALLTLMK